MNLRDIKVFRIKEILLRSILTCRIYFHWPALENIDNSGTFVFSVLLGLSSPCRKNGLQIRNNKDMLKKELIFYMCIKSINTIINKRQCIDKFKGIRNIKTHDNCSTML